MHFPVTPFAYQGFKPWADIVPPANKPGETNESRANKFQNVGHGVVYRKGPPVEFPRDSTNFSMSYTNVEPADFVVPDKRGVSAAQSDEAVSTKRKKKFLGRTTYADGYIDPKAAALLKRSEPEWLIASKKIPDEPIPRAPVRSSYQKDFGMAGEGPETRPYLYKNGMAGSTIDMCEGTAKQTYHIPGYQGHIPTDARNPVSHVQSDAYEARAKGTNLRLYHKHNMTGYTGHQATHATNDRGERLCGANPATTSGATAMNLML